MYKISELEIDHFRVFPDKVSISLVNPEEKPYDFVCIYGPNGLGKTSIVDAIEWLTSGKINRIETDLATQKTTYQGRILENNVPEIDRCATVTVRVKDGQTPTWDFSRRTTKRGKTNDYGRGRVKGENPLRESQILPNSKVLNFISATKPAERMEEWSRLATDKNDLSLMRGLHRLRAKLESATTQKAARLQELEEQLAQVELDKGTCQKLNDSIAQYNQYREASGIGLPPLASLAVGEPGAEALDFDLISGKQRELVRLGETLEQQIGKLRKMVAQYPAYKEQTKLQRTLEKQITDLQMALKDMENKTELTKQLERLGCGCEQLQKMMDERIVQIKETASQLHEDATDRRKRFGEELTQLEKCTAELFEQGAENRKEALKLQNTAAENERRETSCIQQLDALERLCIAVEGGLAVPYESLTLFAQELQDKIKAACVDIHCAREQRVQLAEEEKTLQTERKTLEAASSKLTAAMQTMQREVRQQKLKKCPVCQTVFTSTEQLLKQIRAEYRNSTFTELDDKQQQNQKAQQDAGKSYQSAMASFRLIHQETLDVLLEQHKQIENDITQYDEAYKAWEQLQTLIEARVQTLRNRMQVYGDAPVELTESAFQRWCETIERALTEECKNAAQFCDFLNTLEGYKESNPPERYAELLAFSCKNCVVPHKLSGVEWNPLVEVAEAYDAALRDMSAVRTRWEVLKAVDPAQMEAKKELLDNLMRASDEGKKLLNAYMALAEKVPDATELSDEQLKTRLNEIESRQNNIRRLLPLIDQILGCRETVEKYQRAYAQTKAEHESCMHMVRAYQEATENATALCDRMREQQEKIIESAFSGELVNRFYRMLEPMKDFPKLKFEIEENKEKLELYLKAAAEGSSTKKKPILPELFFSTAQLNTLSLCIFLSNNISRTKEETAGKHVETKTLVMDDPISSFDDINTVAFADLLRILCTQEQWQIILTTHDEKLFRLLQVKIPNEHHNACFMQFEKKGQLKIV